MKQSAIGKVLPVAWEEHFKGNEKGSYTVVMEEIDDGEM